VTEVSIRPFRPSEAAVVARWAYLPPFDVYDGDPLHCEDYLTIDSFGNGYYAIARQPNDDEVIGFCCFGPEARVKGQEAAFETVDIGGGVRPDLVSQGFGTAFLSLAIEFALERFGPQRLRTAVASFNVRSTRLCLSAGFEVVRRFEGPGGEFQELARPPG
jgi:ribosomal-protein-alanine N-acetyltransferase